MRKFLATWIPMFVVCFAVILAGCSTPVALTDDALTKAALSSTYKLSNDTVKITDGKGVWDKPVVGDLNGDGWKDVALVISNSPGGSGTFFYVAVYTQSKGVPMTSAPDLIMTKTLSLAGDVLKESSSTSVVSFEKYLPFIGMSKAKVMQNLGDEPTPIDEGGFAFPKSGLRIWLDEKGDVIDVFLGSKDLDFNGAKIGDKFDAFQRAFGTPTKQDTTSAYAVFPYKGLFLDVDYDPGTLQVVGVHIVRQFI